MESEISYRELFPDPYYILFFRSPYPGKYSSVTFSFSPITYPFSGSHVILVRMEEDTLREAASLIFSLVFIFFIVYLLSRTKAPCACCYMYKPARNLQKEETIHIHKHTKSDSFISFGSLSLMRSIPPPKHHNLVFSLSIFTRAISWPDRSLASACFLNLCCFSYLDWIDLLFAFWARFRTRIFNVISRSRICGFFT